MTDYPFAEVVRRASLLSSEGFILHQKFTCAACGRRVIRREPNLFLPSVRCDRCGKATDVSRIGCNYEIGKPSENRA